ncbi:MAG: hypothetical protein MRK02_08170 [Candidatus Scalindua sp.]|nr:hypothetical protein [Candidatus Scalindua sp.]
MTFKTTGHLRGVVMTFTKMEKKMKTKITFGPTVVRGMKVIQINILTNEEGD